MKKQITKTHALTPDPSNPNRLDPADKKRMARSLDEFGDLSGVILNRRTGLLVGGHQRVDVLAGAEVQAEDLPAPEPDGTVARGWLVKSGKRYALRVVDWDETKAHAALLAANRFGRIGKDDDAALRALLDGLEAEGFDLELAGYTAEALAEAGLRDEPEGEADAEAQIDRAEELNQTWGVKAGDLWLVGEHRLVCGDSTKAEDVAKALNAEPVSMIHADPPYFGKVDEAWDNDFKGYAQFLDFLDSVFAIWIPKTMDRGTSAWWCAPDFAWHIEERLRKYAAVFNHIVWTKGKSLGTTVSVEDMRRWRPRSERLLLCEKQHSPDALLASFNAKTAHIAARSAYSSIIDRLVGWLESSNLSLKQIDACLGTNGMGGHYFGRSQWTLPTKEAWDKLRPMFSARGVDIGEWAAQRAEFDAQRAEFDAQRREFDAETADNLTDVWEMSAPTGEERPDHPTPKPLALVSKLLSAHTRPDDLIADPFLGSGTTMVAAQNLSRKCYGLEISPAYCSVILQRMKDAFPCIDIRKAD